MKLLERIETWRHSAARGDEAPYLGGGFDEQAGQAQSSPVKAHQAGSSE